MSLGPFEIAIIVLLILVLFGYKKLPAASRSLGQSLRIFKGEMKAMKDDETTEGKTESVATPASEAPVTQTTADASRAADTKS